MIRRGIWRNCTAMRWLAARTPCERPSSSATRACDRRPPTRRLRRRRLHSRPGVWLRSPDSGSPALCQRRDGVPPRPGSHRRYAMPELTSAGSLRQGVSPRAGRPRLCWSTRGGTSIGCAAGSLTPNQGGVAAILPRLAALRDAHSAGHSGYPNRTSCWRLRSMSTSLPGKSSGTLCSSRGSIFLRPPP